MKETYCLPHQRHPVSMDSRDISSITDTIRARKMSVDSARLAFQSAGQLPVSSGASGLLPGPQPAAIMPKTQYPAGFSMGRRMSYDNSYFNDVEAMSQLAHKSNQNERESSDVFSNLRSLFDNKLQAADTAQPEPVEPVERPPTTLQRQIYQPTSKKLLRIHSSPNMLANIPELMSSDRKESPLSNPGTVNTEGALAKVVSSSAVVELPPPSALITPAAPGQSTAITTFTPRGTPSQEVPAMLGRSSSSTPESGFLYQTRRLGAWLHKTAGERPMDVSRKDLNSIIPNTF